jgi:hypothetical protein
VSDDSHDSISGDSGLAKSGPDGAPPSSQQALGALKLQKVRKSGRSSGGLKAISVSIPSAAVAAKLPRGAAAAETVDRERRKGPSEQEVQSAEEHASQAAELFALGDHTLALEEWTLATQANPHCVEFQICHTWATYVCGIARTAATERRLLNLLKQVDVGRHELRSRTYCHLAELAHSTGEREAAHDLFSKAKAADPQNETAVRGLKATQAPVVDTKEVGNWFSRMFKAKTKAKTK